MILSIWKFNIVKKELANFYIYTINIICLFDLLGKVSKGNGGGVTDITLCFLKRSWRHSFLLKVNLSNVCNQEELHYGADGEEEKEKRVCN